MDCAKVGKLIRCLRQEKGLTQKQLADTMHLSDKTVSKWERGLGCPDVSLLADLSDILGVNVEDILDGELSPNPFVGGNMKKSRYYVCPICGNITLCTGNASVSCCGRKLEPLEPRKADDEQKLCGDHRFSSDAKGQLYCVRRIGNRRKSTANQAVSGVEFAAAYPQTRAWNTFVVFHAGRIVLSAVVKRKNPGQTDSV